MKLSDAMAKVREQRDRQERSQEEVARVQQELDERSRKRLIELMELIDEPGVSTRMRGVELVVKAGDDRLFVSYNVMLDVYSMRSLYGPLAGQLHVDELMEMLAISIVRGLDRH